MKMNPVTDSSVVMGESYDPDRKVLRLQYKSGKHYEHANMEAHTYREFQAAPSKGKWLNENLRGSDAVKRHPFSQVTPPPE